MNDLPSRIPAAAALYVGLGMGVFGLKNRGRGFGGKVSGKMAATLWDRIGGMGGHAKRRLPGARGRVPKRG